MTSLGRCHKRTRRTRPGDACRITLETQTRIYEGFYRKLKDFNFHTLKNELGGVVELISDLRPLAVQTDMIAQHVYAENEIPFS